MFEKLEETLTMLGNSMKNSAANFTETINLNAKIDDSKKKIAILYGELGEKYYNDNKSNAPEEYSETFAQISQYFDDIENCAGQLKKLAGIRVCPGCGTDVPKGYRFCVSCGTKMPEEVKEPEAGQKTVCEKCGMEAEDGALFCIYCGAKLPAAPKEKKREQLCSRCGAKLIEGARFCTTCGEKVPEPEPEETAAEPEQVPETKAEPDQVSETTAEPEQIPAEESVVEEKKTE